MGTYRSRDQSNGVFSVQFTESMHCLLTAKDNKTVDITILYYSSVHSNTVDCTHPSPHQTTNLTNLLADTCSCVQRTVTTKYSDNTTTSNNYVTLSLLTKIKTLSEICIILCKISN